MPRILIVLGVAAILLTACGGRPTRTATDAPETPQAAPTAAAIPQHTAAAPTGNQAAGAHPRLWLTAEDLPRLRSWASESNPLYRDGLALLAERAKQEMDEGRVPDQDCGNVGYEEYPTENLRRAVCLPLVGGE